MNAVNALYVALGSAGSLLGCVLALQQVLRAMRRRWAEDAEHARAIRENTKAMKTMTAQISALAGRLDDYERRLTAGGLLNRARGACYGQGRGA